MTLNDYKGAYKSEKSMICTGACVYIKGIGSKYISGYCCPPVTLR